MGVLLETTLSFLATPRFVWRSFGKACWSAFGRGATIEEKLSEDAEMFFWAD